MKYKVFDSINRMIKQRSLIDIMMIMISNRIRYVFFLVLIFMWFRNNSYKRVTFNAVITMGITLCINSLIKLFYYKPRPFVSHRIRFLIPAKKDSSFPSKHTLLAFAVSTSILLSKRFLGLIMLVLSVLTGFSRVWVGHHYPIDIIGSAIISTVTSVIVKMASPLNYYERKRLF